LYKSTLFLVVGIIDHRTGTRDLRKLSGVGRQSPVLATVAVIAVISMVGLPPAFGFVAKEAVFSSLVAGGLGIGLVALIGVAVGSIFTAAYSARFLWGAFARKPDLPDTVVKADSRSIVAAPTILSVASLALGFLAPVVDVWLSGYASAFPAVEGQEPYHLALWHGLDPALAISVATVLMGLAMFWKRDRVSAAQNLVPDWVNAADGYWKVMRLIDRTAAKVTAGTQRGSLPFYLGV